MLSAKAIMAYSFLLTAITTLPSRSEADVHADASRRYPVTNDLTLIKEAYANPARWDLRATAVEGTVRSVVLNARGQPSLELALGADGTTIWATWPNAKTDRSDSFLAIGQRLRVLGWLRDTVAWSNKVGLDLPRQNPLTLLPVCLVNVENLDGVFDAKFAHYCDSWDGGRMPPNLAR